VSPSEKERQYRLQNRVGTVPSFFILILLSLIYTSPSVGCEWRRVSLLVGKRDIEGAGTFIFLFRALLL
jgi:hypothetical protein